MDNFQFLRCASFLLVYSLLVCSSCPAQTNPPTSATLSTNFLGAFTTLDGNVYPHATVRSADPESLTIEYSPQPGSLGVAKLKFSNLPKSIRDKYNYDPAKAEAFEAEKTAAAAAYYQANQAAADKDARDGAARTNALSQFLAYYHRTHQYNPAADYMCVDMACDVWDMLRAKDVKAWLSIGNIEEDVTNVFASNHAWVLAEIKKGGILALETTGGYIVPKEKNERYYSGWWFSSPREIKQWEKLRKDEAMAASRWNEAITNYNDLVSRLRSSDPQTQSALMPQVDEANGIVKSRKADFDQIDDSIRSLLSSERAKLEE